MEQHMPHENTHDPNAENTMSHAGHETLFPKVHWSWNPSRILPNEDVEIVLDFKKGNDVVTLDVIHEKEIHLLMISKNLQHFEHIHPEKKHDSYKAVARFPEFGHYKLFADFSIESQALTESAWVYVDGPWKAYEPLIGLESVKKQTIDGISVELLVEGNLRELDQPVMLTFAFTDDKNGKAIQLGKYLGESGHVVIANEHLDQYVHVHPATAYREGISEAQFHTYFPQWGYYKIWGQFFIKVL